MSQVIKLMEIFFQNRGPNTELRTTDIRDALYNNPREIEAFYKIIKERIYDSNIKTNQLTLEILIEILNYYNLPLLNKFDREEFLLILIDRLKDEKSLLDNTLYFIQKFATKISNRNKLSLFKSLYKELMKNNIQFLPNCNAYYNVKTNIDPYKSMMPQNDYNKVINIINSWMNNFGFNFINNNNTENVNLKIARKRLKSTRNINQINSRYYNIISRIDSCENNLKNNINILNENQNYTRESIKKKNNSNIVYRLNTYELGIKNKPRLFTANSNFERRKNQINQKARNIDNKKNDIKKNKGKKIKYILKKPVLNLNDPNFIKGNNSIKTFEFDKTRRKEKRDEDRIEEGYFEGYLSKIDKNRLITKIDKINQKLGGNRKNIERKFTLIPNIITDLMFNQGDLGDCYFISGIRAMAQVPGIFLNILDSVENEESPNQFKINYILNGVQKKIGINDLFCFKKQKRNDLFSFKFCQPYKSELFLVVLEKFWAMLYKKSPLYKKKENETSLLKDAYDIIRGGLDSECYYNILSSTSDYYYNISKKSDEERANIEKAIKDTVKNYGSFITCGHHYHNEKSDSDFKHAYFLKRIDAYENDDKSESKTFVTVANPWGKGSLSKEGTNFDKINEESKNFSYITEFIKKYEESGLFKIPIDMFLKEWVFRIILCSPLYGFKYKVFEGTINNDNEKDKIHSYYFEISKAGKVHIESFCENWYAQRGDEYFKHKENYLDLYKIENEDNKENKPIISASNKDKKSSQGAIKNTFILEYLDEGEYKVTIRGEDKYTRYMKYYLRISIEGDGILKIKPKKKPPKKNTTLRIGLGEQSSFDSLESDENEESDENGKLVSEYVFMKDVAKRINIFKDVKDIFENVYLDPYDPPENISMESIQGVKDINYYGENKFKEKQFRVLNDLVTKESSIYFKEKLKELLKENEIKPIIDSPDIIINDELKILSLCEDFKDKLKSINVILDTNYGKKDITLHDLKEIILSSRKKKNKFYSNINNIFVKEISYEITDVSRKNLNTQKYINLFNEIVIEELTYTRKINNESDNINNREELTDTRNINNESDNINNREELTDTRNINIGSNNINNREELTDTRNINIESNNKSFRSLNFNINSNNKSEKITRAFIAQNNILFKEILSKNINHSLYDILYLIDATGSMEPYVKEIKNQCILINKRLLGREPGLSFKFGGVFYRDPVDSIGDVHEVYSLTDDINSFKKSIEKIECSGGGDLSEDWVGAYKKVLSMNWRNGVKIVIHITDAPAHGRQFIEEDSHSEEVPKLIEIIKKVADYNIRVIQFSIEGGPTNCFNFFKEIYEKNNGIITFYHLLKIDDVKNLSAYVISAIREMIIMNNDIQNLKE